MQSSYANVSSGPRRSVMDEPGALVRGIVVGGVIDVVGTLVTATVLGVLFGAGVLPQVDPTMSAAEVQAAAAALREQMWSLDAPLVLVASAALGCVWSLVAGYSCAVIAQRAAPRAVLMLAVLMTGVGLFTMPREMSPDALVTWSALTFAFIYIGGWIRFQQR